MFRRTRTKLVILNSAVFFVILIGFGFMLFVYTQYKLYDQVDRNLASATRHLVKENFYDLGHNADLDQLRELGVQVLLWDGQNRLIKQMPFPVVPVAQAATLGNTPPGQARTVRVAGHRYRVLALDVAPGQLQVEGVMVRRIDLLYDLAPETHTLRNLLAVVEIGAVVSAALAMLVGLYLANLALIPIQLAWEKQQRFVADASHELRTPLSVMQVHLERLFRHPEQTIEQESENISVIMKEAARMRKLVADLLTLAGSDSDQLQLNKQPVRLDQVIASVGEQFRQVADLKQIDLQVAAAEAIPLLADEERIRQLLGIVLDNAVKYTPSGGTIRVQAQLQGNWAHVAVSDTGIGIPEPDLPHVFDRFYRADKARSRAAEGTGLGLAIARWIVTEHDGKIRAESGPQGGTTIRISLPARP